LAKGRSIGLEDPKSMGRLTCRTRGSWEGSPVKTEKIKVIIEGRAVNGGGVKDGIRGQLHRTDVSMKTDGSLSR